VTANTTEGNSRATRESGLRCSKSHGKCIDTDQKKKRMGALGMALRPSRVPGASGKKGGRSHLTSLKCYD